MSIHNSLELHSVMTYYRRLFDDIRWLYGAKQKEWERDLARLLKAVGSNGLWLACVDLPAAAKHLDQCLDKGFFTDANGPLLRNRNERVQLPLFLGELYTKVFHPGGVLRENASIAAVVAIRQVYMGLKKLELPCKERSISDAVQKFVDIEPQLRVPHALWDAVLPSFRSDYNFYLNRNGAGSSTRVWDAKYSAYDERLSGGDSIPTTRNSHEHLYSILDTLHKVCDVVAALLGDLHSEVETELPKHGPGAVSNIKRGGDKYSFPAWNERLEAVFPYARYAAANESLLHGDRRDLSRAENRSRLIAVPKTLKAPRLIAAEPVENQWAQQLVRNQLETRIKKTPLWDALKFNDQTLNQMLALTGSRDGKYATLDLSDASDRLTCWVIERVFRRNSSILERLSAIRTPEVEGLLLKEPLRLVKHTTMGSAVTFTVQTIVYACVAVAAVLSHGDKRVTIPSIRKAASQVQVFGDDIVVPTDVLHTVTVVLEYLDLKVNLDKTFSGNNFRESCGVDAFRGENVTPVYLKRLPNPYVSDGNVVSLVAASNNLHKNGYWRTAELLKDAVGRSKLLPVVHRLSGLFGYASFCPKDRVPVPSYTRWNKRFQRTEYKALQPYNKAVVTKRDNHTSLLQYFIEAKNPDYVWESGHKRYDLVTLRVGWHPLGDLINP